MNWERLQREAQSAALKARAEAGIGPGPIGDIFNLIDRLGLLYLRYPAGVNSIEGFVARRAGRTIIFTNSSYPRGKEIFTAAHELGHVYLNLAREDFIIDAEIESEPEKENEVRANYFAANFLMPTDSVVSFMVDKLKAEPGNLTAKHIISIQQYFRVSYSMVLIRFKTLGLITTPSLENAQNYGGYPTLNDLAHRCGYQNELSVPDEGVHLPAVTLEKVISLYEEGKIPYGSLAYFLKQIQKSPGELGIFPKEDEPCAES